MKTFGIVTASLVALLVGAKLVLAAFGPVLPPDFDRRWEEDFASAYWAASNHTHEQVEFFKAHGRWPADMNEVLTTGVWGRWRERDQDGWRRWVDERNAETDFLEATSERSVVQYRSLIYVDNEVVPTDDVVCTVTLDAEYAQAFDEWFAQPGARASSQVPDEVHPWSRMDCRRQVGPRAWLSWLGLDRYRLPPPDRYSALDYAERAWEREGLRMNEIEDARGSVPWGR